MHGKFLEFSFGVQGSVFGPVSFTTLLPPLISSPSADLSIAIEGVLGALLYIGYQLALMDSYCVKVEWPVNEKRLKPALVSAVIAHIGLFIFVAITVSTVGTKNS